MNNGIDLRKENASLFDFSKVTLQSSCGAYIDDFLLRSPSAIAINRLFNNMTRIILRKKRCTCFDDRLLLCIRNKAPLKRFTLSLANWIPQWELKLKLKKWDCTESSSSYNCSLVYYLYFITYLHIVGPLWVSLAVATYNALCIPSLCGCGWMMFLLKNRSKSQLLRGCTGDCHPEY